MISLNKLFSKYQKSFYVLQIILFYLFRINEILVWFSSDPSILDECGLSESTKELLISNIRQKLTSQAVKIRADIEVACYGYEGIDAVKTALKTGLSCSTDEIPIKINLIAPPIYGEIYYHSLLMIRAKL